MSAARIYKEDLVRGNPTQPDFREGRDTLRRLCSFYEMVRHDVPWSHIYGMMAEAGQPGSVRLTLEVIKSRNKPFILVYTPESVEKIMGKHTQMGIFRRYTDTIPKGLSPL